MFRAKHHRPAVLPTARLRVEALEDRCLLDGNVLQTNLVSDLPGVAQTLDPQPELRIDTGKGPVQSLMEDVVRRSGLEAILKKDKSGDDSGDRS